MIKHKWKDNHSDSLRHRNQTCERCGVTRQWLGGVWQKWQYWIGVRESFVRPDCIKLG